jgi:hypothetical protein
MDHVDLKLRIFTMSVIFVHIAYVAIFFGILYIDQRFIKNFSTIIQLVVCLFLIIRFWPLHKKHEITKLDVSIIFYCATFLLLNVVSVEIHNNILPYIKI